MNRHPRRIALFALYHLTVVIGIALLPFTLVARNLGLRLPISSVIDGTKAAYEAAKE